MSSDEFADADPHLASITEAFSASNPAPVPIQVRALARQESEHVHQGNASTGQEALVAASARAGRLQNQILDREDRQSRAAATLRYMPSQVDFDDEDWRQLTRRALATLDPSSEQGRGH